MIREAGTGILWLGTAFAALLGLAFGSFLNVCLSRWPEGESVVAPRSHCRSCDRTLYWWENVPLVSWLALRGRCRGCGKWIGIRYPLVEAAVGGLWGVVAWQFFRLALDPDMPVISPFSHWNLYNSLGFAAGRMVLYWLLIALAVLDAENLWLPNWLTYSGMALGFVASVIYRVAGDRSSDGPTASTLQGALGISVGTLLAIAAAAGLILLIRWIYWLVRHREGIGLGDAKLMALLAAWLGLPGALLSFAVGVVLGAGMAVVMLAFPRMRRDAEKWVASRLPLGTFLCVGGVVSALWGPRIIDAYLRYAGFY
jgi:leader peptidase (prepilin peptidase)/N-methyltransferase